MDSRLKINVPNTLKPTIKAMDTIMSAALLHYADNIYSFGLGILTAAKPTIRLWLIKSIHRINEIDLRSLNINSYRAIHGN